MTILEVQGVNVVLEHNNGERSTGGYITGQGNIFTYQATGAGNAVIHGSNNGINWTPITDTPLVAPDSLVLMHSWLYIRVEGTATVTVSRG